MSYELTSQCVEIGDERSRHAFTGSSILKDGSTDRIWGRQPPLIESCIHRHPSIRFQTDESSVPGIYGTLEVSRETVTTGEPYKRTTERGELLKLASGLVEELVSDKNIFKKIDKDRFFKSLSLMIHKLPLEQVAVNKEDLAKRLEKIMALEVMSGILDDLTPEQLETFAAEVKRKPFFK